MWVVIAISTVCSIAAQLTLKFAMSQIARAQNQRPLILKMALSPWLIGGLALWGFGFAFWLVALSYLEVSFVYPFASLSYVGVMLGSHSLFKEHIPRTRLLGIGIIIIGVLIVGLTAGR